MALLQYTTLKVLQVDTKTESEDEFETDDCAFDMAFDGCAQLNMQWYIYIMKSNFRTIQSTAKISHRL